ncbi:MAG: EAL domain-containing protein [Trueperaceae bacterium]|nr:MAG: EAL domain-containing protein [Trueperaceae bacterium]
MPKFTQVQNELEPLQRNIYLLLIFLVTTGSLLTLGLKSSGTRFDTISNLLLMGIEISILALLLLSYHRFNLRFATWLTFLVPATYFTVKFTYLYLAYLVGNEEPAALLTLIPWSLFTYAYSYLAFGRRRGLIASGTLLFIQLIIGIFGHLIINASSPMSLDMVLVNHYLLGFLSVIVFYLFAVITEAQATILSTNRSHQIDPLTGLPNRAAVQAMLAEAIGEAKQTRRTLAVLFIDIDRFKAINDTLGHNRGDELLRRVAERLNASVRQTDFVARLGGDEFSIVLRDVENQEQAMKVAQKILGELRQPFQLHTQSLTITASLGVSLLPQHGDGMSELLSKADSAMYRAKETGRNRFHIFSTEIENGTLERSKMERSLRKSFENGDINLVYQPIFDISRNSVVSFETLLRWTDKELGIVSPAQFIPLAEGCGLIGELGAWVLEKACRQVKVWQEITGISLHVAVNISALQLSEPGFVEVVKSALSASGLAANQLELEVTESIVLDPTSVEQLSHLRTLGISVLLDDFGTGYSSLGYLQKLPIDGLKIDKSFIQELTNDPGPDATYGNTLVETVIRLAKTLGMSVIAEGVETKEQLGVLRTFGCNIVQGYFFSRPLSPYEVDVLLPTQDLKSGRIALSISSLN